MTDAEKKPREFELERVGHMFSGNIAFEAMYSASYPIHETIERDALPRYEKIKVIEYSAYKAAQEKIKHLEARVEKLRAALHYYSLKSNYSTIDEGRNYSVECVTYELDENTYADVALGTKARAALKEDGES